MISAESVMVWLASYIWTLAFCGLYATILILSIVFYKKTKRKPFVFLFLAFCIMLASSVIQMSINWANMYAYLYMELGWDVFSVALAVGIGNIIFAAMSIAGYLFIIAAVVGFYREAR